MRLDIVKHYQSQKLRLQDQQGECKYARVILIILTNSTFIEKVEYPL